MNNDKKVTVGGRTVTIVSPKKMNNALSASDKEMDKRAAIAVRAAVNKAEVCKNPIAKYDKFSKKAYVEYPDGKKNYVE